jgi:glycerol-1-phosphate dehydrogenase [NAD(P)+]
VLLQQRRRALLHGAKVGVAAVLMAREYRALLDLSAEEVQQRAAIAPSRQEDAARIRRAYGAMADQVIAENATAMVTLDAPAFRSHLVKVWGDVLGIARLVPSPAQLTAWLEAVQGPTTPAELGVEPELVQLSLDNALFVRNRFTVLRLKRWLH